MTLAIGRGRLDSGGGGAAASAGKNIKNYERLTNISVRTTLGIIRRVNRRCATGKDRRGVGAAETLICFLFFFSISDVYRDSIALLRYRVSE